ncbi:hypothetical protein ABB02_01383 [Clostridiaceae bacterium JG1575]|nr:hypothetical protein ABB02_01383 [Clostridiaceae bacterium JG1575]
MNNEKTVQTAMRAGRIILEAGGETYRVEDTMTRILTAYGMNDAQSFVTPTGIFLSCANSDGTQLNRLHRIRAISVDLEKIAMVNALSRRIDEEQLSVDQVDEALAAIIARPMYPLWLNLLASSLAALSFTLIFRGIPPEILGSALAGPLVVLTRRTARGLNFNPFLQNAFGGLVAVLVGAALRALGWTPTFSTMVIGTIMLLVPGITITNAIRDTFQGDYLSGVTRAMEALVTASGIAFGTAMGFLLAGVI